MHRKIIQGHPQGCPSSTCLVMAAFIWAGLSILYLSLVYNGEVERIATGKMQLYDEIDHLLANVPEPQRMDDACRHCSVSCFVSALVLAIN